MRPAKTSVGLPRWLSGKEFVCQCRRLGFGTWVRENPLEMGMATHSSMLAWKIPWTEEPAGYSPWGHRRVRHDLSTKNNYTHTN